MAKRDYLVDAARQIRMALDREVSEDYEAAFNYYKKGVDLLLNGIQVDPNKEQREAVKRKTTQYLKRAEEIFISHLQNNNRKGGSQMEGYSSLRFRPMRHLNSPVEDLKMYKVVGIIDKVLTVQSLVNKETFIVKSLSKTSGNCRDRPTIIPQNVPFMVKLLRYYESEDVVYLHLEHVKGGKLFSKLHKLRPQAAKEYPECFSTPHKIGLKNSYTSPAIMREYGQDEGQDVSLIKLTEGEPADAMSPAPWYEAQQRLESCQTHSYSEETGCLQHAKLDKLDANLNQTLVQNAEKTPDELSAFSSHKRPGLSACLRSHTEQQQLLNTNSETLTHCPGSDETCLSSNLSSTAQELTSNNNTGAPVLESVSVSMKMNSALTGKAINPRCNRTSSSGNSCSQIVLSSHDFHMQHMIDPAGGVFGETSAERLRKPGEVEQWDDLGPLGKEKLPEKQFESRLGSSPSSSLIRDTNSPTETEGFDMEQIIEVNGWYHVPQLKRQASSGRSQLSHWGLPEVDVQSWGAQILVALESLHEQGIICCDLNPNNILLNTHGKVCLTYFGQWSEVQPKICPKAMEQMYCAPEIGGMAKITEACDWWSLGALLYELLTGMPLWQCHPTGVDSHTLLIIPDHLSTAAASLLTELLQLDPGYRLGSGGGGVTDIKCHPFFHSVVWPSLDS